MSGSETSGSKESVVLYDIEDRPPVGEAIPLGIQHVLAMFLGNVAPPLILAGAVGSVTGETVFLVQMALIIAGFATIVQAFPNEVQTLFGSALVTGGFAELILNIVLPAGGVGTGPTEYTAGLAPDATEGSESGVSGPATSASAEDDD